MEGEEGENRIILRVASEEIKTKFNDEIWDNGRTEMKGNRQIESLMKEW